MTNDNITDDYLTDFTKGSIKMLELKLFDTPWDQLKASYSGLTEVSIDGRKGFKTGSSLLVPLGLLNTSTALFEFKNSEDMVHVIDTLKFGELSKVDPPEYWSVYKDEENGFSFPYASLFKLEKFTDDLGNQGVRLIYDFQTASGFESVIPPKIALEARIIKTSSEKADVYASNLNVRLQKDPLYANYIFNGVGADSINFKPGNKISITARNFPNEKIIFYEIIDVKGGFLEIKGNYYNTRTLSISPTINILDSTIYKMKIN
jgi:hypothetical protein